MSRFLFLQFKNQKNLKFASQAFNLLQKAFILHLFLAVFMGVTFVSGMIILVVINVFFLVKQRKNNAALERKRRRVRNRIFYPDIELQERNRESTV